jgi:chemotaxis protein methyltransferase CheR
MTTQTVLVPADARLRPDQAVIVSRIAREKGGLAIAADRVALLQQRLSRRLVATGHADFDGYITQLLRPGAEAELQNMIEALTTHTTAFFREASQFDWLRETGLPQLVEAGARRDQPLTFWSAACSTGAEMWTAAMVLDQFLLSEGGRLRWQVLGSDISGRILARASRAIFDEGEISGLPEEFRQRYLLRSRRKHGTAHVYRISPELRRHARLFQANLVEAPPPIDPPADVVMMRNVLIYFDAEGREAAVRNAMSRMRRGGFLMTGHTESLHPVPAGLVQVGSSIYVKV